MLFSYPQFTVYQFVVLHINNVRYYYNIGMVVFVGKSQNSF